MTTSTTYQIKGMHCASCAGIIEKSLKKTPGVENAEVNFATESAKLVFDPSKTNHAALSKVIKPLGYTLVAPSKHHVHLASNPNQLFAILPMAVISLILMALDALMAFGVINELPATWTNVWHYLLPLMALATFMIAGKPYLLGVYRFLRYGAANMDTLIGIGTSAAFIYSLVATILNIQATYFDVTIVVITFITLGKFLEARAKVKTGDAIAKLLNLQAKTALVLRGNQEVEIPVSEVVHGDLIIVKPGSNIPVDGVITTGSSYINEAMVTGEPMPTKKEVGDTVISGTLNTDGSFTFQATKVGNETMLARIIKWCRKRKAAALPFKP